MLILKIKKKLKACRNVFRIFFKSASPYVARRALTRVPKTDFNKFCIVNF